MSSVPSSLDFAAPAVRGADPEPADGGGFFRYHGVWAPGVRLFRRLPFNAKALIISSVFLVPIVLLAAELVSDLSARIAFAQRERQGVDFLREALPLLKLTQQQRDNAELAASQGADPAAGERVATGYAAQYARLLAQQDAFGARFATADAFKAIPAALPALPAKGSDPTDQHERYTQFASDQLALIQQVMEQSNLAQDPDLVSGLLAAVALKYAPEMTERSSQLRSLGTQALIAGELTAPQRRLVGDALPMIEYFEAGIARQVEQAGKERADIGSRRAAGGEAGGTSELRGLARRYFLGQTVAGDLDRFRAAGARGWEGGWSIEQKALDGLQSLLEERIAAGKLRLEATFAVLGSALLLAGYLFWSFRAVTEGGFRVVNRHVERMRDGDLTRPIAAWGRDEASQLIAAVRELQSSLGAIVGDVRGVSAQILDVSTTLADHADQAVARNAEAVASLQHCVATVAEITAAVDCAQTTVEEAVRLSDANASAANSGQQAVERQLATMDELARSSRQIGEFTDVIGSISFQTNILALNAAVEAARAGEAGRGFAVVATEVRALADRAAAAGKEIGRLIAANAERVERSARISVETGQKMTSLVANAQQMNRLLELIAKSAEAQNTSTRGVNASLQTLDRGSGQGTERATQTAADAAQMLKGFAGALADRVATFRI